MSALYHLSKPSSELHGIFICRTNPGGFRAATDWPEGELTFTQTVKLHLYASSPSYFSDASDMTHSQRGLCPHLDETKVKPSCYCK